MKNFYALWIFVGLMYVGSALGIVATLAVIAADEYPELIQVFILATGFSGSFMCAFWGDYVRLQLTMYELRFISTDLEVRKYKKELTISVVGDKRIKRIAPENGKKQRTVARG